MQTRATRCKAWVRPAYDDSQVLMIDCPGDLYRRTGYVSSVQRMQELTFGQSWTFHCRPWGQLPGWYVLASSFSFLLILPSTILSILLVSIRDSSGFACQLLSVWTDSLHITETALGYPAF